MVAEGLVTEVPLFFQNDGIESHLSKQAKGAVRKFNKYGLPIALDTPEREKQTFKSRGK